MATKDGATYESLGELIPCGGRDEQDAAIGTGGTIYNPVDKLYYTFYTGNKFKPSSDQNAQVVMVATSPDFKTWTKNRTFYLKGDTYGYDKNDFRDPFLFQTEDGVYHMLIATRKNGKGHIAEFTSTDLKEWASAGTFMTMMWDRFYECPDVFKMGDWYYLVFSSYADRYQTMYRKSRSPYGPWQTPEIDTFDTRAFYAAKTGSDGVHRYVYGWNPTREVNEHNFDPPGYPGKDCNTWDWGGSLVVHELWQDENGDLFVKPIPQVLEAVGWEEPLQMQALTGEWKLEKNQAEVDAPYDFGALLLNPVGETSRLSFDVEVDGDCPSVGIAVHVEETFTVGYYLLIDFGRRRIEFKSGVRMTERGGQMFPYEVELERPLPMSTGKSFHVDVIADGTILEAYVDGKIALGTRMYDQTGGCFGLYASDGKAVFRDIKVFHA